MIGTTGFIGERLEEAIEARGLTNVAVSQLAGVTPMAISQYISGKTTPRPDVLETICERLNFPHSFFTRPIAARSDDKQEVFWRSFSGATVTARKQAGRRFRWLKRIVGYLREYLEFPSVNVPMLALSADPLSLKSDDIERFATQLREHWKAGTGPISDAFLLMENNGVIVSRSTMATEELDAFSQWSDTDRLPYIIVGSDKNSAARARYNAGHEVAHLVLHRALNDSTIRTAAIHRVVERQAFRFASAFFLPQESFLAELWAPTLDAFRSLKDRWKISIAAMIKRSEDLGLVNEDQARRLWINYNRRGWRTTEPLDDSLPGEKPRLLRRSVEMLISERIKTKQQILDELSLPASDVEEICGFPFGYFAEDYEAITLMPKSTTEKTEKSDRPGVLVPFQRKPS